MSESASTLDPRQERQPAFRAPWPVLAVVASIIGGYAIQAALGDPAWIDERFGFSADDLGEGRWGGLVTALFVHGGWTHALLNALGALAFGAPVAKLLGTKPIGVAAFFGFYLVCGVLASLGFGLVTPGAHARLIGASGAIYGLMGAASRLLDRRGLLASFTSRTVVGMALACIVVNLLLAVFGVGIGTIGAPLAWQAHLFGYAAGLALIGRLARLLHRL